MIELFRGEYNWLSNFSRLDSPLIHEDVSYPTVEHFYQAMQFQSQALRKCIAELPSKGLKKHVKQWDSSYSLEERLALRKPIMRIGIDWKFSSDNERFMVALMDTDGEYIREGNYWNDTYWGYCLKTNKGFNVLGKMIMQRRDELFDMEEQEN